MVQAFYTQVIENIWHKGSAGNKYRLDSVERVMLLKNFLEKDKTIKISSVMSSEDSILYLAHSPALLESYKSGAPIKLANSSGIQWQQDFYSWLTNIAWCNVYSAQAALESGIGIAMADGGHHAEWESGYGFNPINNLVITSKYLLENKLAQKIAILDLDVHYANGTHSLVKDSPDILSTDIWKYKLDKWKYTESGKNVLHFQVDNVDDYFVKLDVLIDRITDFEPDIILYYLGLDVLETDRMGGFIGFGGSELEQRENKIAVMVRELGVPVSISIGGGYLNYKKSPDQIQKQKEELVSYYSKAINILRM